MASLKTHLVSLLQLASIALALTVNDFKPAFFQVSKPSAFFNVDTGSPNTGEILAFVDINGDKYTDYIATDNRSLPTLNLYTWNDNSATFVLSKLTLSPYGSDPLTEIMINDLNADGLLDLVATHTTTNNASTSLYSQIYKVQWNKGNKDCFLTLWSSNFSALAEMTAVPTLIDRFGNGTLHLLTFQNQIRTVVTAVPQTQNIYTEAWNTYITNSPNSFSIVDAHFASMIDINGDCFSDLVLLSNANTTMEIYIKNHLNSYDYSVLNIGKNIVWLNFADFDGNGAADIFIVAHESGNYTAYVLPNLNSPSDICVPYTAPSYDFKNLVPLNLPSTHKLLKDSNIKIGDFNFDGFPDLLGIFSIETFRSVSILANKGGLKFAPFQANLSQMQQINNPVQTSLYDFAQDGQLDVIVVAQITRDDGSTAFARTSIINNIIEDTLFIKILPLLPSSQDDFTSTALVNALGITIQWRITNLNGDKTISLLNQKIQSNYGSLQLPFATAGLGRTNNYIEDLTIGYPGYGKSNVWTPVIPNSQLILLERIDQPWVLETLLKDNSRVYDMIYISILCLIGMGVLIVFLNWKENQEDKRDQYNFIHMIR